MHQNIEKQREIYRAKRRKDPNLEEQRNFEKQLTNKGLHAGESVDTCLELHQVDRSARIGQSGQDQKIQTGPKLSFGC